MVGQPSAPRLGTVGVGAVGVGIGAVTGGAGAAGGARRAVSISYADCRSMSCPYLPTSGEPVTAAVTVASGAGAISVRGARTRVQATGVGDPRSDSTVTIASPVPRPVRALDRS